MRIFRCDTRLLSALALVLLSICADELNFSESGFADWKLAMADQLVEIKSDSLTLFGKDYPKGVFRKKAAYSDYELC
jgi:hypothetical protein